MDKSRFKSMMEVISTKTKHMHISEQGNNFDIRCLQYIIKSGRGEILCGKLIFVGQLLRGN